MFIQYLMPLQSHHSISVHTSIDHSVNIIFFIPDQNKTIKQADTILLTYPLAWNMSTDIMKNDLQYYEPFLQQETPAMTYRSVYLSLTNR